MLLDSDKLTIARRVAILVCVPLIVETLILAILGFLLFEEQRQAEQEAKTEKIIDCCDSVSHHAYAAISQLTMYAVIPSDRYLRQYQDAKKAHDGEMAQLEQYCQGNPSLEQEIPHLKDRAGQIYSMFEEAQTKIRDRKADFATGHGTLKQMTEFRALQKLLPIALNKQFKATEYFRELVTREDQPGISSTNWKQIIKAFIVAALLANVLLSLALAKLVATQINSRLRRLVDNTIRLASGKELCPRLGGSDEIAKVDDVFHSMADKFELSNKKEKSIVDNAVDLIGSLDRKGRFTAVNRASINVLGYEPADLLGRHISDIVVAENNEKVRAALQTISSSAASPTNESQVSLESGVKCNDGRIVQILWSIYWSDREQEYFIIAHDITELKQREELLKESESRVRLILESMPVGLLITNTENLIEVANMRASQMFAYANSELLAQPLSFLFARDWQDRMPTANLSVLTESTELEACKSTGEKMQVELSRSDFYLRGEQKILAIISDITERKEIEGLKKEFVAMLSHDLRAPLINIQQAFATLLAGQFGKLDERSQTFVGKSARETERLIELINSLLDMENLETGKLGMQREWVDVTSIVSGAIASVGYLAEKSGIQIHSQVPTCKVLGDGRKLVQVLVNLLANAIKFSPKGSTISIIANDHSSALKLTVIDQGRGIPESHRRTIFERFKQVQSSDQTIRGGTGLGLAICKAIVEAHGGEIGVDSIEGKGSMFWLSIPTRSIPSTA